MNGVGYSLLVIAGLLVTYAKHLCNQAEYRLRDEQHADLDAWDPASWEDHDSWEDADPWAG